MCDAFYETILVLGLGLDHNRLTARLSDNTYFQRKLKSSSEEEKKKKKNRVHNNHQQLKDQTRNRSSLLSQTHIIYIKIEMSHQMYNLRSNSWSNSPAQQAPWVPKWIRFCEFCFSVHNFARTTLLERLRRGSPGWRPASTRRRSVLKLKCASRFCLEGESRRDVHLKMLCRGLPGMLTLTTTTTTTTYIATERVSGIHFAWHCNAGRCCCCCCCCYKRIVGCRHRWRARNN